MGRSLLGKIENVFDPQQGLRIPGVLNKGKSFSRDDKGGTLTLVRSSLILTHGRPLIDAILITMFSALLFS
jgi:hypothetical protein